MRFERTQHPGHYAGASTAEVREHMTTIRQQRHHPRTGLVSVNAGWLVSSWGFCSHGSRMGQEEIQRYESGMHTLLVVEDDLLVRRMVVYCLRRENYRVLDTDTVYGALELLRSNKVDLLFSDVRLPDGYGDDLAVEATMLCPGLKAIVVSGAGRDSGSRWEGVWLVKPVVPSTILAAIREELGK